MEDQNFKVECQNQVIWVTCVINLEIWKWNMVNDCGMTVVNNKKLEAAHHKWMRRITEITWEQRITNEEVRKRTGMGKIEQILRINRLRWMGHVSRMGNNRLPPQAMKWMPKGGRRNRSRPRKNRRATIEDDLNVMRMPWQEAEKADGDRTIRRICIARCTGRTKVYGKERVGGELRWRPCIYIYIYICI